MALIRGEALGRGGRLFQCGYPKAPCLYEGRCLLEGIWYLLSQGIMIIICNNDIMIFPVKLVVIDLKSIISYLMHSNKNKNSCHAVMDKQFL